MAKQIKVKILESKPSLYDLFKLSISLSDKDLELLKGLAQRINELQNLKEE